MARQEKTLRCSFCHKNQETVGRLISNPSDYPRAYICDECIQVCNSIIEDDRKAPEPDAGNEVSRFVNHPLAVEFLDAAERWAVRDLAGLPAADELIQLRMLAAKMLSK
jgi:hypothetical protein